MSSWNALAFLRDYKLQYRTEGANAAEGWVNVCCPMCHEDNFHGGFNLSGGYYNCWKCGKHIIPAVIKNLLHINSKEAKEIEDEYSTRAILSQHLNTKKATAKSINLPGSKMKRPHRDYIRKRGYDPEYLEEKYQILGTGPGELFNKKLYELSIIIPIINKKGKVISFQARDITDRARLRYKAAPIEDSVQDMKQTLYNLNNCNSSKIGIVEGVFDVWRMGDNFAATFGTGLTDGQIKALLPYDNIYWLFDPEAEAQKRAKLGAEKLASMGKHIELIELDSQGRDPGELTDEEAQEIKGQLGL